MTQEFEVIIIGAGISGMTAARKLELQNIPYCILEAQDRIGGRVYPSQLSSGQWVDFGAQFIGEKQKRLYKFLKENKIEITKSIPSGKYSSYINGIHFKHQFMEFNKFNLGNIYDFLKALYYVYSQSKNVITHKPWIQKNAINLDKETLEKYILNNFTNKDFSDFIRVYLEAQTCIQLNKVTLLDFFTRLKSFETPFSLTVGEEFIFNESAKDFLSSYSKPIINHIILSSPVCKIIYQNGLTEIHSKNKIYTCKELIITIPPSQFNKIEFINYPDVLNRIEAFKEFSMGEIIKVFGIFDSPYWRKNGYLGVGVNLDSPISTLYDGSYINSENGILIGFIPANLAKNTRENNFSEIKNLYLKSVKQLFGPIEANLIDFSFCDWNQNQWIQGGFNGFWTPGSLTKYKLDLTKQTQNIHWAGAETATEWIGFIEGAIQSGERAFKEIMLKK